MSLKLKVLYLVSLAAFLRSFAQVIYVPSLGAMRGELQVTATLIGLSLSVYGFVLAFAQIAYGPIVDRLDSKRVLLAGLVVFALGSLGGYLTRGIGLLLAARALQAVGIAAAASVGIALITDLFPAKERGRAMGVFSMFNSAGAAAGPAAGAALALAWSWRAGFLALVATAVAMVVFVVWQLPAQPVHGQRVGLGHMWLITRTPATGGALALGLMQFYGLYTIHSQMPLLLSDRVGLHEGGIGVVASLLPVGVILGSLLGGWVSDRRGLADTLRWGALGTVLAYAALTGLSVVANPRTPVPLLALAVGAYGLTAGFGFPAQISIMVDFFPALRGTAGALQFFARFVGSAVAPIVGGYLTDHVGLPAGFATATVLLAVGALLALFTVSNPQPLPATN